MIHPTAVVDPKAKLGSGVTVGAYSIIGPDVEIQENTEIAHHVVIEGPTIIGSECRLFPFASIGQEAQDKKFQGEKSRLEIGNNNVIREYVTINRGTKAGGGATKLGDGGWIMAYCHIAHDCIVGNDVTMSNGTTLGGHVVIKNHCTLGGLTAIHQFCRIGEFAFTGAHSVVSQDVAPFSMVAGDRAKLVGMNLVGMERRGFSVEEIKTINRIFRIFFKSNLTKDKALKQLKEQFPNLERAKTFTDFIKSSERGICR